MFSSPVMTFEGNCGFEVFPKDHGTGRPKSHGCSATKLLPSSGNLQHFSLSKTG